jgi:hypothetical protein
MPDCWGWATWKNRWESFNTDAKFLLNELESKNLMHKFNVYGASNMQSMLQLQIQDKVNSWAIRWTAVCILNNWLTLYPNPSMSQHIASENATHANTSCTPPLCNTLIKYKTIPIEESDKVNRAMIKGYSGTGNYYGQYIFNKNTIKKILIKIKSKFL